MLLIVRFLLGDFKKISAKLEIFTKQRPDSANPGKFCSIEVDDLALLLFEMENGVTGTIEATKVATGANDELRIEIHGEKGAIRFNSMQPNYLEVYDTRAGKHQLVEEEALLLLKLFRDIQNLY